MKSTHCATVLGLLLSLAINLSYATTLQKSPEGALYMSGGIGVEEVTMLQENADQFNLYLLFSEGATGTAADGVDIEIYNSKKQLAFSLKDAAPRVNVNLPAGKYSIHAVFNGEIQGAVFHLKENRPRKLVLNWKDPYSEAYENDTLEDLKEELLLETKSLPSR